MLIRTNDLVEVIAGDDRGTRAKVVRVDRRGGRVVVEGVNRVYKHVRRSQKNPQGGRLSREMPVDVSNVQFVCASCGKKTRLGLRMTAAGAKERYCRKCGASNGIVSPPRSRAQ